MSDENTARHAECTVEFDGVDITSRKTPAMTCKSNSKTVRVSG